MLLAALALLSAQVWVAAHELDHLAHPGGDGTCEICLAGQGYASPLPSVSSILGAFPPAAVVVPEAQQTAAGWTCWCPHLARAPPFTS